MTKVTNRILVFVLIFIWIMLWCTSCSTSKKNVTEQALCTITAGMTEQEIVSKLGKPDDIITDNKEAHFYFESDYETELYENWFSNENNFGDKAQFLNGQKEKSLMATIKTTDQLISYHYDYIDHKKDESTHIIYFIDGKVVMISYYISLLQPNY